MVAYITKKQNLAASNNKVLLSHHFCESGIQEQLS